MSLVVVGVLFSPVFIVVIVGWHVWALMLVSVGLCKVELILVAVGWQVWVSLMVGVVLFKVGLGVVAVGWLWWALLVVGGLLFNLVLIGGVVRGLGLRSVAVFRWRTYCMMLIVGLRG